MGLNIREAMLYLAALELGKANVSELAKKAGIKRTTAYLALESLKEKGLVSAAPQKNTRTVYWAENPKKIQEMLTEHQGTFNRILPELLTFTNLMEVKPAIRFFEGKEGIKELFKDMLRYPKQEILEWYSETYALDFEEEFFVNFFTPERVKKEIFVRAILPGNEIIRKLLPKNQQELRRTKLIDPEVYKIGIEINVYGGRKVSIISFREKIGLLIESKTIAESMKNIFDIMWNLLPERK